MAPDGWRPRWREGFFVRGSEFEEFWASYLGDSRRVSVVHAFGFDPRATHFLPFVFTKCKTKPERILSFELKYPGGQKEITDQVAANRAALMTDIDKTHHEETDINIGRPKHGGESSKAVQTRVRQFLEAGQDTDVIIDINAMPKSVAMAAISTALSVSDDVAGKRVLNVHVVVDHNPQLDQRIRQTEINKDAFLLAGFIAGFDVENPEERPGIWMPILGRGRLEQLQAVAEQTWTPKEKCPVVPSPSQDPRHSDELVVEYDNFLERKDEVFRQLPNVLRVSEDNPFEAYQQLVETIAEFGKNYQVLGGCRVLVTAHSTKLLSLAGLLAVYEAKKRSLCQGVSFAFVEAAGHKVEPGEETASTPYSLWLAGDAYG